MDAATTKEPMLEQTGKEALFCRAARCFVHYHRVSTRCLLRADSGDKTISYR